MIENLIRKLIGSSGVGEREGKCHSLNQRIAQGGRRVAKQLRYQEGESLDRLMVTSQVGDEVLSF